MEPQQPTWSDRSVGSRQSANDARRRSGRFSSAARRKVAFLERDRVQVPREKDGGPRARDSAAHDGVADALATGLARDVSGDLRFLPDRAADLAKLERARCEVHQTGTPKSRSAEFSDVLRSVLCVRVPMISAHGVRYSPAGKLRGRMPGITTLRAGIIPLITFSFAPVTSWIGVLEVSTTPAPSTASSSTRTPSTTMHRLPMNAPSSMITGRAPGGSRTPPSPTPPERCTPRPTWAQEPTVAQVSTMLPAPTRAPMFT